MGDLLSDGRPPRAKLAIVRHGAEHTEVFFVLPTVGGDLALSQPIYLPVTDGLWASGESHMGLEIKTRI